MEVVTASPEETEALAARLARDCGPGDVVAVSGELGAGKTTFVRGAARALGVDRARLEPDVHDRPPLRGADARRAPRPLPPRRARSGGVGRPRAVLRRHDRVRRVARARRQLAPESPRGRYPRPRRRVAPTHQDRRVKTILAFDTATSFGAVCAVTPGGARGRARTRRRPARGDRRLLGRRPAASSTRIVVGTRPGQLHEHPHRPRDGPRRSRFALDVPVAGRLDARRVRRRRRPVIDARRGEVFTAGPARLRAGGARRRGRRARRRRRGPLPRRVRSARRQRSRPTTTPRTVPTRCCSSRTPGRSAPPSSSSRSTCASPTRRPQP